MSTRPGLLLALAVLPLWRSPTQTAAPVRVRQQQGEDAFQAGWAVVAQYLADQHWDRARERLSSLLETHRAAPYVLLRRPQVVEALERIAFFRAHRPPRLEDLVQGELVRWHPHSGRLELRYAPDQLADFWLAAPGGGFRALEGRPPEGAVLVHPAQFVGPCKLTLEGRSYAPTPEPPTLYACMDLDSRVALTLGFRARQRGTQLVYVRPAVRFQDRGHDELLAESPTTPIETGDSYTLSLSVEDSAIALAVDGREFMRTPRPRGARGRLGLSGFSDLARLTLEGEVEASWLEGLLDQEVQRQWAEFGRRRDRQADLPDWLRLPAPDWDLALDDPELASGVGPSVREPLTVLTQLVQDGDLNAAAGIAAQLAQGEEPLAGHVAWLLVEYARGRWEAALEHSEAILVLAPELRSVRRVRAAIELTRRDLEPARRHLAHELELDPRDAWARARMARLELLSGNLGRVDAALRAAADAGAYTAELDDVNRTLTKARSGPPWRQVHEYRYDRFLVRSDIDRQTCLDASQTLGTALALFEKWLRRLPPERREPFSVFVFSGRAGYLTYAEDVLEFAPENTAGVYSPWLRQLLIWNLPEREAMLATIRHEGFHQYLDSLVGASPIWLDEGLAEVWEAVDARRFDDRRLPPAAEHVGLLQSGAASLVPLERFLYMERGEFLAMASWNYAQAWALVHMLFEDSRSGRHLLLALIDGLIAGKTPLEATREAFAPVDLADLDRALAEHVKGL